MEAILDVEGRYRQESKTTAITSKRDLAEENIHREERQQYFHVINIPPMPLSLRSPSFSNPEAQVGAGAGN